MAGIFVGDFVFLGLASSRTPEPLGAGSRVFASSAPRARSHEPLTTYLVLAEHLLVFAQAQRLPASDRNMVQENLALCLVGKKAGLGHIPAESSENHRTGVVLVLDNAVIDDEILQRNVFRQATVIPEVMGAVVVTGNEIKFLKTPSPTAPYCS